MKTLYSPDPADPSAPPPAAEIVINGKRTEREIILEHDLESERGSHARTAKEKKDREVRIAELEDELRRLKTAPRPEPAPEQKTMMESFFQED